MDNVTFEQTNLEKYMVNLNEIIITIKEVEQQAIENVDELNKLYDLYRTLRACYYSFSNCIKRFRAIPISIWTQKLEGKNPTLDEFINYLKRVDVFFKDFRGEMQNLPKLYFPEIPPIIDQHYDTDQSCSFPTMLHVAECAASDTNNKETSQNITDYKNIDELSESCVESKEDTEVLVENGNMNSQNDSSNYNLHLSERNVQCVGKNIKTDNNNQVNKANELHNININSKIDEKGLENSSEIVHSNYSSNELITAVQNILSDNYNLDTIQSFSESNKCDVNNLVQQSNHDTILDSYLDENLSVIKDQSVEIQEISTLSISENSNKICNQEIAKIIDDTIFSDLFDTNINDIAQTKIQFINDLNDSEFKKSDCTALMSDNIFVATVDEISDKSAKVNSLIESYIVASEDYNKFGEIELQENLVNSTSSDASCRSVLTELNDLFENEANFTIGLKPLTQKLKSENDASDLDVMLWTDPRARFNAVHVDNDLASLPSLDHFPPVDFEMPELFDSIDFESISGDSSVTETTAIMQLNSSIEIGDNSNESTTKTELLLGSNSNSSVSSKSTSQYGIVTEKETFNSVYFTNIDITSNSDNQDPIPEFLNEEIILSLLDEVIANSIKIADKRHSFYSSLRNQFKHAMTNNTVDIKLIQATYANDVIGYCRFITNAAELRDQNFIRFVMADNEITGVELLN